MCRAWFRLAAVGRAAIPWAPLGLIEVRALCSLVFIKKYSVIEADKKVPSQLRVMNLSDASPYETLHAYVSSAVAPYFKSYVKETGRAER